MLAEMVGAAFSAFPCNCAWGVRPTGSLGQATCGGRAGVPPVSGFGGDFNGCTGGVSEGAVPMMGGCQTTSGQAFQRVPRRLAGVQE